MSDLYSYINTVVLLIKIHFHSELVPRDESRVVQCHLLHSQQVFLISSHPSSC